MANFSFSTKAETLAQLTGHLLTAKVPPLLYFTSAEWINQPSDVLAKIQHRFGSGMLAIRSSARGEDSQASSHAGEYESILDVPCNEPPRVEDAIRTVLASYPNSNSEHQVLVQQQLTGVVTSGVLFTRDLSSGAPYLVINYDDTTGRTDGVTSGRGERLKCFVQYKRAPGKAPDPRFTALNALAAELERYFACDHLDIEFAFTKDGTLWLLQVRPLAGGDAYPSRSNQQFDDYLLRIYKKIQKLNAPHPGLLGEKAIYSVMTDWNPAEMIGTKPRPLAASIYREIITDSIWAYQRHNYGYRDLRGFPLMVSFLGAPYIDVRASLNSFVPKSLDARIAAKLVDYYIDRLSEHPSHHDKVEFEIVFSCYSLDLPERLATLRRFGFSERELDRIKFSLLTLTNEIIAPASKLMHLDFERLRVLERRFQEIDDSDLPLIDKIYWLTEDCRRYGTLPFAGLARAGFIGVQLLQSCVATGILREAQRLGFMRSLNTVARQLSEDSTAHMSGRLSRDAFLARYGHLRPGTYDICSPRYDEDWERYFKDPRHGEHNEEHASFFFSEAQLGTLTDALAENGLTVSGRQFVDFLKRAIEGREYGKFVFSKSVSRVLQLVEALGRKHGFDRDDMSFLRISTILDLYAEVQAGGLPEHFSAVIKQGRADYELLQQIKLPQLILNEEQVYRFHLTEVEPNFVTTGRTSQIVVTEERFPAADLSNKIVLVRSADPGYDWLFARHIAGLVTMYGGANSHMAIRCAELGIPAVIGCGEANFERWSTARILELDCANRLVTRIE